MNYVFMFLKFYYATSMLQQTRLACAGSLIQLSFIIQKCINPFSVYGPELDGSPPMFHAQGIMKT